VKICSVDGCENISKTKGFCGKHYHRLNRYGDANISKRQCNPPVLCTVDGCTREHAGKGFCTKHLKKFHKYGDPLGKAQPKELKHCSISGCTDKYHGLGFCAKHLSRFKKYGDPLGMPPENPIKLSGGRRVAGQGEGRHYNGDYFLILCPCHPKANKKGYVKEHRLIMEVFLGRFLTDSEVVHHKDCNKKNNDINNLEILTPEEHLKKHWILRRKNSQQNKERIISNLEFVHCKDDNKKNNVVKKLEILTPKRTLKKTAFWDFSPRKGNKWAKKKHNEGVCKKDGCTKQASVNSYCHNHNRDNWRNEKRALGLKYS